MTNLNQSTQEGTMLVNVVINQDRKYSQSYGWPENNSHAYGLIEGDWVETFDLNGYSEGKQKITGKHFHKITFSEITLRTFKMRVKKARKNP